MGTLGVWLVGALFVPMIVFAGLTLLEQLLSRKFAFWVGLAGIGLMLFAMSANLYRSSTGNPHQRHKARLENQVLAIVSLGGLFYLLSLPNSDLAQGFGGLGSTRPGMAWAMFLFFIDNFFSVAFFDIPELIFDLHLSLVSYDNPWSRGIVVLIRLLIGFGIINLFVELFRHRHQGDQMIATVKECYSHCAALILVDDMQLRREGKLVLLPNAREIAVAEFLELLKDVSSRGS